MSLASATHSHDLYEKAGAARAVVRFVAGILVAAWSLGAAPVRAQSPRFFFSGDGFIALTHAHFDEQVALRYRDSFGHYDPVALQQIAHLLRSREDGAVGPISLRLIELLDFIEDRARPQRLVVVSGYRSPTFNEDLRRRGRQVAGGSLHMEGMAIDLQPDGVSLRRLWLDLRDLRVGGVGYYKRDGFLHLDTGPPRFWEEATSRVGEDLAKGNAKVFARTDFDRYGRLEGAVISLHRVTAFPIRIARHARLGKNKLPLHPVGSGAQFVKGCFVIGRPAVEYRFRIGETDLVPPLSGARIELLTCSPRVEATAARIDTNPVEALPASVQ